MAAIRGLEGYTVGAHSSDSEVTCSDSDDEYNGLFFFYTHITRVWVALKRRNVRYNKPRSNSEDNEVGERDAVGEGDIVGAGYIVGGNVQK